MNGCCEHEYEIQYSFTEGTSVGCLKCKRACRILPRLTRWTEGAGTLLVLIGILTLDPNRMTDKWWEYLLAVIAIILTIPFSDWLDYRFLLRARRKGTIEKYIALLPGKKYISIAQREADEKLLAAYRKWFEEGTDDPPEEIEEFLMNEDDEEEEDEPEPCGHEWEVRCELFSALEVRCPLCGETARMKRSGLSVWRPVLTLLTLAACIFLSCNGVSIDEYFKYALFACATVYFTAAWLEYRFVRRAQKKGRLDKYVQLS